VAKPATGPSSGGSRGEDVWGTIEAAVADPRLNGDHLEPKRLCPRDVLTAADRRFAVEGPRASSMRDWPFAERRGGQWTP